MSFEINSRCFTKLLFWTRVGLDGEFTKTKVDNILKLYQQYFLISLTISAFVCGSFLFGVQNAFREFFKGAERVIPVIQWPYWHEYIAYSTLGLLGLVSGVAREFHIKQDELLRTLKG